MNLKETKSCDIANDNFFFILQPIAPVLNTNLEQTAYYQQVKKQNYLKLKKNQN